MNSCAWRIIMPHSTRLPDFTEYGLSMVNSARATKELQRSAWCCCTGSQGPHIKQCVLGIKPMCGCVLCIIITCDEGSYGTVSSFILPPSPTVPVLAFCFSTLGNTPERCSCEVLQLISSSTSSSGMVPSEQRLPCFGTWEHITWLKHVCTAMQP